MKAWLGSRMMTMDRRALLGLLAAAVLFVALEAWLLVLRSPLAEWHSLMARGPAQRSGASARTTTAEADALQLAITRGEGELRNAAPTRSDDDTVLFLIGTLGPLAASHGVGLELVKAGGRRVEQQFTATSFDVEARGAYLALNEWLREAEALVAPLAVAELTVNATDAGRQVVLKMKLTAYTTTPAAGGGP